VERYPGRATGTVTANRPSIVWITLDSVRADHTTIDGYRRETTPNLEALATDGTASSNCFAHSNATLRSSASILTGMEPSRHTVGMGSSRLPDEVQTVPERFAEVGYKTACLSRNSHLSEATGLDRGFDRFEWLSASTLLEVAGIRTTLSYLRNIRKHSAGFTLNPAKHATPFVMNEVASRWLRDLADAQPFFLYLHYNEPHRPYFPPLPYLEHYTDEITLSPAEATNLSMEVHRNCSQFIADGLPLDEDEWEALKAMYDAEIAYTDDRVGALIEEIRTIVGPDCVIVVTADHGELFGEGGMLAHRVVLHDAVLRVPLIVSGLDVDVPEERLVQHADVMMTLLARADGRTEGLQGVPLETEDREHVFAERGRVDLDAYRSRNPEFDSAGYRASPLHAVRDVSFKYLESGGEGRLHELPDEDTEVSATFPDVRESLARRLHERLEAASGSIGPERNPEFTRAMQRQLKDLGYFD